MSVSSLQKKMTATKSLLFVFLVGLLSLTFFVFVAKAAVGTLSSPTTTVTSTQHILFSFSTSTNDSSKTFSFSSSTNGTTWSPSTTVSTSTGKSFDFGNLSTNTLYYLRVAEGDASNSSTYATTSVYTLAAAGLTPTVAVVSASSVDLTLNLGTNPETTEFSIYNTTTGQFVDAAGASSASAVWQASTLWNPGHGLVVTGLTANTSYQFVVIPRNGNSIAAATSTASTATTTLANTPSSASVSAAANGFTFSWSGDSTDYYAEDVTAGTNSGWITGTLYSIGGINCGTAHTFRVKGRSAALVETAFSSSVDGTTSACGSGIIGGGGSPINVPSSPATPATPAVPGVSPAVPATPATPASVSLPASASSVAVFVHTLKLGSRSNEVKLLQQKLRELGYFTYPTNTGYFGGVTKAAVVAFQKAYDLKPFPGHVGPATRAALNNL